jgi:hypothetical protein
MTKILWATDSKLDESELALDLAAKVNADIYIFAGNVANFSRINEVAKSIRRKLRGKTARILFSSDCAIGTSFCGGVKKLNDTELALHEMDPLILTGKDKHSVAVFGQNGCEDIGYGTVNVDHIPARGDIVEFIKPSLEDRFHAMKVRSGNEVRKITRKFRIAYRDRSVYADLVFLGVSPFRETWDYADKALEEYYAPFHISKAMGDLLFYRDSLKTRVNTHVFCCGGETFKKEKYSPSLHVVQSGGYSQKSGNMYLIESSITQGVTLHPIEVK